METLASGVSYVDLRFLGHPRVIATAVIHSPGGVALVDPGPTTCLDTLRGALADQGIALADLRAILLTHIHLDHAGATGSLVKENPEITVFVHEKGAPHMASPEKLLASAGRLYGDRMDEFWGEMVPIPSTNIRSLHGGEQLSVGDRQLEVAYTPGHASHHVAFFDSASGVAFVGDTAGMRLGQELSAIPPTPPPDIDIEAWLDSVDLIRGRHPATLFITHFGPQEDAESHLDVFVEHLTTAKELSREVAMSDRTDDEKATAFADQMLIHLQRSVPPSQTALFDAAPLGPLTLGWLGLRRYWKQQGVGV